MRRENQNEAEVMAMARALMIQGTGSHVGKSVISAALCRIFRNDGIDVAPFKSQNMALNSFITIDGGEMGRAQAVQAEAAGLEPQVDMNPILIKPHTDIGAQVIIQGKVRGNYSARDFHALKAEAMRFVEESYSRLSERHELIIIEGAGSPAEVNLRENDIANMGTAHLADAPVILVGDIDRGGVFASLVGTLELLDDADRRMIRGFIINKFRGDRSLLQPGIDFLEERTGLPVLGVVPFFRDIYIEEEDGVKLDRGEGLKAKGKGYIDITVIHLPHISNFTDFDPLAAEPDVHLRYAGFGERIGRTDMIILPGSKSVISDLGWLRKAGYAEEIRRHAERGGVVVGICGGYQMLGERIADPCGVEGGGVTEGLGLLAIETVLEEKKVTRRVSAALSDALPFDTGPHRLEGYEIHMGRSSYIGEARPLFLLTGEKEVDAGVEDGNLSGNGRVWGTYMHGIFDNDLFRRNLIDWLQRVKGVSGRKGKGAGVVHRSLKEEGFRRLAERVRKNVDIDKIYRLIGPLG